MRSSFIVSAIVMAASFVAAAPTSIEERGLLSELFANAMPAGMSMGGSTGGDADAPAAGAAAPKLDLSKIMGCFVKPASGAMPSADDVKKFLSCMKGDSGAAAPAAAAGGDDSDSDSDSS